MAFRKAARGQRLGEYVMTELIGEGPSCDVWRAEHHVLEGRASVKVGRTDASLRVLRASGVAQHVIRHERIVKTLGLNLESDPPFLVTELVEGTNLRRVLGGNGPFKWEDALDFFRDVLAGLSAAHEKGSAHGNLKPENLLRGADGRYKLTDFATGRELAARESAVVSGIFLEDEKPEPAASPYLPPELASGGAPDPASDVWSLGILLFEVLTGKLPQGSETPSDLSPGLPPQADHFFRNSFTRPERRFKSAQEAAAALFRRDAAPEPEELVAGIVSVERRPKGEVPEAHIEEIRILSAAARCPACGHRNGVEYKFCVRCGLPLSLRLSEPGSSCPSCGRAKHHRHRFCSFCGGRYA